MSGESRAICDGEALQGEIALARKGLLDKSISISALMEGDDEFLPVLIFGLETGSSQGKSDAMSILQAILKEGTESQKNAMILSGVINTLIPLLLTRDDNDNDAVRERALYILGRISENSGSRKIFWKSDILPVLTQLVAINKTRVEDRLRLWSALHIVMKMTDTTGTGTNGGFPSSSSISKFVRLLAKLLTIRETKNDDDKVAKNVMVVLIVLLRQYGGFPVVLSSGILPSVIDLLARPDEELQSHVFLLIGQFTDHCGSDELKICEFFEALKGSTGLKHYHKIMKFAEPPPHSSICNETLALKCRRECRRFFDCVKSALDSEDHLRLRMTNAVIASRLDHALLQLLSEEKKETSISCQFGALAIVYRIRCVLHEEKALQPLLGLLNWSYRREEFGIHMMAVDCLEVLIQYNSKCWDELIRLGGLRRLIRRMKNDKNPWTAYAVLKLLGEMLREQPEGGLEPSKKVAKCLNSVTSYVETGCS